MQELKRKQNSFVMEKGGTMGELKHSNNKRMVNKKGELQKTLDEREMEEKHLAYCVDVIQKNIDDYTAKLQEISQDTKELYDNYRSDNPELHNDLVVGLDWKSQMERTLKNNLFAQRKPYFGRIDYFEKEDEADVCLYIGKKGIRKDIKENMIIDWRAAISSVYYDSDIGESTYQTPYGEQIDIVLKLKRTYEIENSKLVDFYDSDVVANDEFLTKYLSKNKEVVLGEIIATIQKEQNEIIRDTPWHSVIVQGVAGSGKTTVAMHRISYILYNYQEKFRPDEFYIIGSNKMLLNYITGVLPNLDVYNVKQMTMEEFLLALLDKDFNLKKGKYTIRNSFLQLRDQAAAVGGQKWAEEDMERNCKRFKGSLSFLQALECYLKQYEQNMIMKEDIVYHNQTIYGKEEILYFLTFFDKKPMQEKMDLLNKRLAYKITSVNEEEEKKTEIIREEVKKYKNYFGKKKSKINLIEIYQGFIQSMIVQPQKYKEKGIVIPGAGVIKLLMEDLQDKKIDIYDLGMLTFIKKRLKFTDEFDYISHIVVDEAQDFGVIIFGILKKLFDNCTYTIMGDVSQNIYYDTGMNDWEALQQEVFYPSKDKFYVLAKSYRNTVEISNYAGKVLKHCTFKTYDIEPIIRHGREVAIVKSVDEQQMVEEAVSIIQNIRKAGYDTVAVICRTIRETLAVQEILKSYVPIEIPKEDYEGMTFQKGIMVLPIHMTKGLEFDAVLLWNPDERNYRASDEDAKLLYVAITRALHELHILYQGNLSPLLQ